LDFKFTTRAFATGIPTVLAGSPVVEIYEDNSTTQITAAETLTVDFDSVVGLNNLRVVATAANGFESGKTYSAVLSAGTVGGVSVVGEVVAQFSIERSPALRPTTANRTLDVTATGAAGIDWGNVENKTTANDLTGTNIKTDQKVDVNTIKTQTVTCAAGVTVGVYVGGTAAHAVASTALSNVIWTDARAGYLDNINGHTPQTGDSYGIVNDASYGNAQLVRATIPSRTLDISAQNCAGIDWANIDNIAAPADFTQTTVGFCGVTNLCNTLTTYTGNTPQTADHTAGIAAIPTNPMLATEDGSSFSAIPDMATATNQATIAGYIDTEVAAIVAAVGALNDFDPASEKVYLGNGAHGGAAATFVLSDYSDFQGGAGSAPTVVEIWAGLDATQLAKFVTVDTGETTAVAGSVGKIAQGSAGGGGPLIE
jgi:hypothetical protein